MIILVTGAGGVFGNVLVAAGVGDALAGLMTGSTMPIVVLAFLIATVVRVAQGSATVLSHVNDSGFWLVSRFLGMSEGETLRSWTVMVTLVGLVGFAVALLVSAFL
jgi:Gnt-I system low-affinity gluconate transporter